MKEAKVKKDKEIQIEIAIKEYKEKLEEKIKKMRFNRAARIQDVVYNQTLEEILKLIQGVKQRVRIKSEQRGKYE